MKQVSYRGGIIKFEIPDHWVEEYGENGGGTFYEDAPDSATLRLNLLTFESESKTTRSDLARVNRPAFEYHSALESGVNVADLIYVICHGLWSRTMAEARRPCRAAAA